MKNRVKNENGELKKRIGDINYLREEEHVQTEKLANLSGIFASKIKKYR